MPYDVVAYEADDLAMQLSEAEEGLFHRMLRRAWMNGSIPSDLTELKHICRTNFNRLKKAWIKIEPLWQPHPSLSGRLINLKQESERDYREKIREQNRLAGVESAKAKKAKETESTHVEQPLNDRSTSLPSPPLPIPNPTEEGEKKGIPRKRGRPKTEAPESLEITMEMFDFAMKHGVLNVEEETAAMLDNHRAKGNQFLDWTATWRTWMRNHKKYNGGNSNGKPRQSGFETRGERTARINRETFEQVDKLLS